ncbi:HAD family hydrolase [uncultured Dokdonia sp.]|uniref:HAD family hydrolase n=1 Tax=uncultured Dokdonia sp. TaxID=575653 RepID=UPI00262B4846|nr:HAD family hydrolase [uncultured Dokdonia sp.]
MNKTDTLYVFDIDGTLTDSIPTYLKVITKVLEDIGLKDIDTDYDNYLHHTDRYALEYNYERNFGKKAPDSLRFELDTLLETELQKHDPVIEIPGARDLLLHFQKSEIPFAYGTGAFPKATAIKMKDANIPLVSEVLATSITSISRVGFVQEAIEKSKNFYNQDFKKIVAVGDGLWDLKAAQELNIDFLGVGLKNKEAMYRHGCTQWVENFRDYKI